MATWLNLLTAGPYATVVYRDAVQVTDLAAVGATLEVVNGRITLETPNDEAHEWAVGVIAQGISSPAPMRMRGFSLSSPNGLSEARALGAFLGAVNNEISLTVAEPNASPDPAAFDIPCLAVVLVVNEEEGA